MTLDNILKMDAIGLSTHLAVMVTDNKKRKEFLAFRGSGAQSLLNLLQAVRSCAISYPLAETYVDPAPEIPYGSRIQVPSYQRTFRIIWSHRTVS